MAAAHVIAPSSRLPHRARSSPQRRAVDRVRLRVTRRVAIAHCGLVLLPERGAHRGALARTLARFHPPARHGGRNDAAIAGLASSGRTAATKARARKERRGPVTWVASDSRSERALELASARPHRRAQTAPGWQFPPRGSVAEARAMATPVHRALWPRKALVVPRLAGCSTHRRVERAPDGAPARSPRGSCLGLRTGAHVTVDVAEVGRAERVPHPLARDQATASRTRSCRTAGSRWARTSAARAIAPRSRTSTRFGWRRWVSTRYSRASAAS